MAERMGFEPTIRF